MFITYLDILISEPTPFAFVSELRLLQFGVKILGSTEQKGADGGRELCDILLFDILRVYRMSLLELSLRYCGIGNKLVRMILYG